MSLLTQRKGLAYASRDQVMWGGGGGSSMMMTGEFAKGITGSQVEASSLGGRSSRAFVGVSA